MYWTILNIFGGVAFHEMSNCVRKEDFAAKMTWTVTFYGFFLILEKEFGLWPFYNDLLDVEYKLAR